MNGKPGVNEETRRMVLECLEEMKKNNDSKKDDNNYAKKDKKNKGIWIGIVLSC